MQSDFDIISGVLRCLDVSSGDQWQVITGLPSQMKSDWCVFKTQRCLSQAATVITGRH